MKTDVRRHCEQMRKKARSLVDRVGQRLFLHAQGRICPICEREIVDGEELSIDHVHSIYELGLDDGDPNSGNILIVHHSCNQAKGSRKASASEIVFLAMVNDILQFDESTGEYGVTEHLFGTVRRRISSLKIRQEKLEIDSQDRARAREAMLSSMMYEREIEALEQLTADYNEVLNVHN